MIRKIDHVVITTVHLAACIAFYKALEFRVQDAASRWELFAGDFKINVHRSEHEFQPKAEHVQTGSADFCFEIDCPLTECGDDLIKKGIDIEIGLAARHGVRGEMHSIYLRDPDGNLIELCSYE